jgi:hypothetical protein
MILICPGCKQMVIAKKPRGKPRVIWEHDEPIGSGVICEYSGRKVT